MKESRLVVGLLLAVLAVTGLAGCATYVPEPIRQAPVAQPTPNEVRAAPADYEGVEVRWGGIIAGVENRADHSLILVVSRPLQSRGRPLETDAGYGRFLARVPGFVDPAIYTANRKLTVRGHVLEVTSELVGDFPYPYVVVDVEAHYLWPQREPYRDPYYYDPWWPDPWFHHRHPFRPWP